MQSNRNIRKLKSSLGLQQFGKPNQYAYPEISMKKGLGIMWFFKTVELKTHLVSKSRYISISHAVEAARGLVAVKASLRTPNRFLWKILSGDCTKMYVKQNAHIFNKNFFKICESNIIHQETTYIHIVFPIRAGAPVSCREKW